MEPPVLAKYPFHSEASSLVKENRIELGDLLNHSAYAEARRRGKARVMGALRDLIVPTNDVSETEKAISEILSYPYARVLVSCIGDELLVRRYAVAEAKTFNERLKGEPLDLVMEMAAELKVGSLKEEDDLRMHFTDFLAYTSGLRGVEWKLVNQDMRQGFVQLNKQKFIRVLEQALNERIEDELPLLVNEEVLESVHFDLIEITRELEEFKEKFRGQEMGEISILKFPPCMKKLVSMAQAGENMPHAGRFALVTFLGFIGMPIEDIIKVFYTSPDFDNSMTTYQVRHITGDGMGKKYTPPECATMKTNGICFEPDELCNGRRIRHPLTYYRIKARHRTGEKKPVKAPSAPSR